MKGNGLKAQLLRAAGGSMVIKFAFALISFLLSILLARTLGAEGFGAYSFALAIIMLLATPAQVGIPELIVRETAKIQVKENWSLLRGLWKWGNWAVVFFSGLALLIAVVLLVFIFHSDSPQRTQTILIGLALIPLMALGNIRSACIRGLRHTVLGQLSDSIIRPGLLLLFILCFAYVGSSVSLKAENVMLLYVAAVIISYLVNTLILGRVKPIALSKTDSLYYESKIWIKAIIPLALVSGFQLVNSYADIIILGLYGTDAEVGIYKAVLQLALLVSFGLQAINQVLHPHFSRLYTLNEHQKLQNLVTISARAILLISLPLVLILVFFGADLLKLFYGDLFYTGGVALAVLAIGQLINTSMGSVGALLNMTGHERYTVRGVAFAAVTNIVLNIVLIPPYGMLGAAIATAISMAVWNLLLRYYVIQKLKIEPSGLFKPLKSN